MAGAAKRFPRTVGLEPQFAALLPEVLIGIGPEQFAAMAARALAPKPVAEVSIAHIHMQRVSVREQAAIIVDRLKRHQTTTFRALIADCETTLLVIGRFLALLELYREQVVAFEQITPLGDLTIRWTGTDETDIVVTDEFDVEREVDRTDSGSDSDVEADGDADVEADGEADGEADSEQSQDEGTPADE
jgi:segregation and condensation protein A